MPSTAPRFNEQTSEAIYEVHAVTALDTVGEVRDLLAEVLEKASYPIRQIDVVERSPEATEIVATLVSTAVDPVELDAAADKSLDIQAAYLSVSFARQVITHPQIWSADFGCFTPRC